MESFVEYFSEMPTWHRLVWVAICMTAGWLAEDARPLVEAAHAAGAAAEWFADSATATEFVQAELRDGDLVLVKGSRGIGLELLVATLLDHGGAG